MPLLTILKSAIKKHHITKTLISTGSTPLSAQADIPFPTRIHPPLPLFTSTAPHSPAMPPPSYHPSSAAHTLSTPTTTTTSTQTQISTPVLRLRATAPEPSTRRRIQWAEDVVDNEGLGRKSSKGMTFLYTRLLPLRAEINRLVSN